MNMGSSQSGMATCAYVSHMHHKLPVDLVMKAITLGHSLTSDEHWTDEKYISPETALAFSQIIIWTRSWS